ncbi:MAG: hypothetical protein AAFY71_07895 [Bacteroidota bacterium]
MKATLLIKMETIMHLEVSADSALLQELIKYGTGDIPEKVPGPSFDHDSKMEETVIYQRMWQEMQTGRAKPFTNPTYHLLKYQLDE